MCVVVPACRVDGSERAGVSRGRTEHGYHQDQTEAGG